MRHYFGESAPQRVEPVANCDDCGRSGTRPVQRRSFEASLFHRTTCTLHYMNRSKRFFLALQMGHTSGGSSLAQR